MTELKNEKNADAGPNPTESLEGYKKFRTLRIVAAVVIAVAVLWLFWFLLGLFGGSDESGQHDRVTGESAPAGEAHTPSGAGLEDTGDPFHELDQLMAPSHDGEATEDAAVEQHDVTLGQGGKHEPRTEHGVSEGAAVHRPKPLGVHFVEGTISALDYELNERFWGWRRNDLIRFTDNVENMQLGILEVVRRSTVNLTERISRHGPSAAIEPTLENAMNWLMIKPDRYWLPSAEEKYRDSLKELHKYAQKLERGEAHFYNRTDNLIPLLASFADLAGSCDENLVKQEEDDGSPISWFKVDDYFYYAKGVARAMQEILHGVREDFSSVLETRRGIDLLNRAIHSCHVAAELEPWGVTDAPLDGILANHRANMAAEISHVRYFLNALAKALST